MVSIDIPGKGKMNIENLVLDFNGTIAYDGNIKNGIREKIQRVHEMGINIYILTADTYHQAAEQCKDMPITLEIFDVDNAALSKREIVNNIDSKMTMTIGNGNNDVEMFEESILSVAVIGDEGCAVKAIFAADIITNNIDDAIDLLLNPHRIKATLRM
ncbi:ATPase, P-type (transporting), HAD superfamily, subfamily IC [Acetoanaerobium noterae]|uniref:ATPase, P-type (Transporting), HAD superfamily, subfamily IC n=1 Tax=Acetoanaerobium noterae TaxID=745369 RepID=A0A1T5A3R1_9FIRM|nr:HAD hydrolase family protein [Acetoanaerobium noterae]SKB29616.1 ATPase, P-type (transporting), HAD superfamily, subfamily IC [Acetoanaerobium noterae]